MRNINAIAAMLALEGMAGGLHYTKRTYLNQPGQEKANRSPELQVRLIDDAQKKRDRKAAQRLAQQA